MIIQFIRGIRATAFEAGVLGFSFSAFVFLMASGLVHDNFYFGLISFLLFLIGLVLGLTYSNHHKVIAKNGIEARLEDKAALYQQNLEEAILARTDALYEANRKLHAEIIEREKAHQEALYQSHLAQSLCEISATLNKTLDLKTIFKTLSETIGRLLPYETLSFMLCDEHENGQVYACHFHEGEKAKSRILIQDEPFLRMMAEQKVVIRLNKQEAQAVFPKSPVHQALASSLSAPIFFEEKILGFIHLGSKESQAFNAASETILEAFAAQLAIAIHNAQQYQTVQEMAVIEERGRIARDLHDAVTQTLFSANLLSTTLLTVLPQDARQSQMIAQELQHLTRGSLAEMRALLLELRPQCFEKVQFEALIQQLADAFYSRTKIPVEIITRHTTLFCSKKKEGFYRIVQEALNNIGKHSKASHVKITMNGTEKHFQLTVEDDGIGFQPEEAKGMGLTIMAERAEQLGAVFQLNTSLSAGTKIMVDWRQEND